MYLLNASETLETKPIFLAVLCSTDPKKDNPSEKCNAKRKFIWREDSGVVSILLYDGNGYYYECVVCPTHEARAYWQGLIDSGWICRVKKTERMRGFHVRTHADRIQKENGTEGS